MVHDLRRLDRPRQLVKLRGRTLQICGGVRLQPRPPFPHVLPVIFLHRGGPLNLSRLLYLRLNAKSEHWRSRQLGRAQCSLIMLSPFCAAAVVSRCAQARRAHSRRRSSSRRAMGSHEATGGSGQASSARAMSDGGTSPSPRRMSAIDRRGTSARARQIRDACSRFNAAKEGLKSSAVVVSRQETNKSIALSAPPPLSRTRSPSTGGTSSNRPSFSALASSKMTSPGASQIRPSADREQVLVTGQPPAVVKLPGAGFGDRKEEIAREQRNRPQHRFYCAARQPGLAHMRQIRMEA